MPRQPVLTYFLHVYDVESGLWGQMTLGSVVSPRSLEAMNAILLKDGILAFIGTRFEFGHYLSKLKNTNGTDYRDCWTSLPASTVLSMLGLCLNTGTSGRPELVFYGSPLTITVMMLKAWAGNCEFVTQVESRIRNSGIYEVSNEALADLGVTQPRYISSCDWEEALTYMS